MTASELTTAFLFLVIFLVGWALILAGGDQRGD